MPSFFAGGLGVPAILALWLMVPTLTGLGFEYRTGAGLVPLAARLVFATWILAAPLIALRSARGLFWFWLPAAFLAPLQTYLIYFFHSVPGDALTASALHVSPGQVADLLSRFGALPLLLPVSWLLYVILLRRVPGRLQLNANAAKNLAAGMLLYAMAGLQSEQWLARRIDLPPLFDPAVAGGTYPASVALSLARVLGADSGGAEPNISLHPQTMPAGAAPRVIVLVIGESVRPDHLGLNGYARDTTPQLARLGPSLLSFPDVASTANYTFAAVPNIVRRKLAGGSASLVSVMREAGYRTAWFSNQQSDIYQPRADISDFSNTEWRQGLRQDSELLPLLESCLRQCGARQFIVLHMYGSHFPYDARYLARDRVYSPTFADARLAIVAPTHKRELINSYDNTLLAADRFLAEVIARTDAAGKPALVLYTSDHGENLYDDERAFVMHAGPQPTRADMMVPLLLWTNQAYRAGQADKLAALRRNVNGKLSHLAIFPTLLDLADIHYDGQDPQQSFASAAFKPGLRVVGAVNGKQERIDDLR